MSLRKILNPLSKKALALALIASLAQYASAQSLDDEIDAELDNIPEQDASSPNLDPAADLEDGSLDELQIDDGGDLGVDEGPAVAEATPAPAATPAPSPTPIAGTAPQSLDELQMDNLQMDDVTAEPTVVDAEPAPQELPTEAPPTPMRASRDVTIDAPNEAFEKRLGQISEGYRQVPDMNWEEIVADRRQESYGIQRGDTLWDISETFFGDGFFWAKLWSQNGVIENPHRIVRGKAIRFVAGTEAEAPAIGVMDTLVASNSEFVSVNPLSNTVNEKPTYRENIKGDISQEEVDSGVVLETSELIPAPELPPASKRAPVLSELPPSFRAPEALKFNEGYDSSGIKGAPQIRANEKISSLLNSVIFDQTPDSLGKIDEIETQDQVAHQGQAVYVRLNREIQPGARVTFGRVRRNPAPNVGPVIDVLGVGVVTSSINEGRNAYRVMIISSLAPVEKGASVFGFAPPAVSYSREGRRNESAVSILGGEYDDRRKLIGAGSVIYLAGGTNVGLQVGDIMGVQAVRGERRTTGYPNVKTPIALIRVADVKNKVATAVILVSNQPVQIGDRTGGDVPDALPSLRSETADQLRSGF